MTVPRLLTWICVSVCLVWMTSAQGLGVGNMEEYATLEDKVAFSRLGGIDELCAIMSNFPNVSACKAALSEPDDKGNKTLVSQASTIALFDACNPREQTVALPRDPDPRITVWPICTRVKRCGGCCTSDVFTCSPTETRDKYVKVFKTLLPYPGAHQFQFLGVRIVKLEEHTRCDAQCRIKEHECHKYQVYEPRKCRCRCRTERLSLKQTCKDNQIWDEDECNCICPTRNSVRCPEPSVFSETTCKCTLKTSVTGEIDLEKLFAQLDSGLFGRDFIINANEDGDANGNGNGNGNAKKHELLSVDGGSEEVVDGGDTGVEKDAEGGNPEGGAETSTDSSEASSTEEATTTSSTSTTTTTTTTTTPAPTTTPKPKRDPCKKYNAPNSRLKCRTPWKPVVMGNGRCMCMPPNVWKKMEAAAAAKKAGTK